MKVILIVVFCTLFLCACDENKEPAGFVLVKGGTFRMGCTDESGYECVDKEKPAHLVTVADFYIGKYEVTRKIWKEIMGVYPADFYIGRKEVTQKQWEEEYKREFPKEFLNLKECDDCPVTNVSWIDIQDFLKKINTNPDVKYSLPTEAEWEFAAIGGNRSKGYKYSGSNDLNEVSYGLAEFQENSGMRPMPVGGKKPNELGIYDMSGNVWEWCEDWSSIYYYEISPKNNPVNNNKAYIRIMRGGSWFNTASSCRVSTRGGFYPEGRDVSRGFRLVLKNSKKQINN